MTGIYWVYWIERESIFDFADFKRNQLDPC